MFNEKNKKRGFILLVGILVAMIIFSVGVVMANIVFRELILSFTARESNKVFFSADTGVECGRYWDNARGDTRYESKFNLGTGPQQIECDDTVVPVEEDAGAGIRYVWLGQEEDDETDMCINIEVEHCEIGNPGCNFPGTGPEDDGDTRSTLRSWAFNFCDPEKPRRVDRAIRAQYVGAI